MTQVWNGSQYIDWVEPDVPGPSYEVPDFQDFPANLGLCTASSPEPVDAAFYITATPAGPTGGAWTITFDEEETDEILSAESPAPFLWALTTVNGNNVETSGVMNESIVYLTFLNDLGERPIDASRLSADGSGLTGPGAPYTLNVVLETPGVVGGGIGLSWEQPWD